ALEAQHFDAMLLDLRLNDESGLELLKHWSGRFDLPATVLLSGCVDVPTTVRAMRIGVVDVLQKPVDTDKLDQRLRAAVATRNAGTNGSGEEESEPLDSILGEAAIVELLRRD